MRKKDLVERKEYLDFLAKDRNVALLGRKKAGKTLILKSYLESEKNAVYIDLEKLSLTPEKFSIEFIGNVMFNFLKKSNYVNFLSIDYLIKNSASLGCEECFEILKSVENELLKIKPNQRFLVESAFNFVEVFAAKKGKKIIVCFDNFENILDLNNFSQIKDILSLIDFESENVRFVAASSLISQFRNLKNFEVIELKNLDKNEASVLIQKLIGKVDKKVIDEIFNLSKGHPFVLKSVALRFKEVKDVRKAFLVELLCKDSFVYDYCKESLNFYLNLARGQSLLRDILKVVSREELRLSEVARGIYRSAPITKAMIERLVLVDLISKKDSRFVFNDKILQLWLKLTSEGYDFEYIPEDKVLEEIKL